MTKHIVKDVPIGVLTCVISQFFFYAVYYIAKFPSLLEYVGILAGVIIGNWLFLFGLDLIKGIEIAESE